MSEKNVSTQAVNMMKFSAAMLKYMEGSLTLS